ncbi:MAG: hypothetical protein ACRELY_26520 [Polyangiaceae bacterium]
MTEAELDRIASGIRPSWELDDAPFRPAGFASPELDALLSGSRGGNGAHSVHTNGAAAQIIAQPIVQVAAVAVEQEELRTTVDPRPPIELVEAPIAPAVPAARPVSAPPPAPAPAAAPAARAKNGVVPPAAQSDPFAVPSPWEGKAKGKGSKSSSSAELAAMKKSSSGLWVAIIGGVVAIGIAIFLFAGSSSSSKNESVKQEPSAQQIAASAAKTEIPPPPATDEIPTAKATAAPPPPPAETAAMELPATATTSSPPPPAPTQPAHVSHNAEPSHHTTTSHPSNPPSSGGGKKGGGIVHDVPF